MSFVDIIRGLELLVSRANAVHSDFILAGPVNLWFRGIVSKPEPHFIMVTSSSSCNNLLEAVKINARELDWPPPWHRVGGKSGRYLLYNRYLISVLADPVLGCEKSEKYYASELAVDAWIIQISDKFLRLAPLDFELELARMLGDSGNYL